MILPSKLQSNKSDQSVSAGSSSLSSAFTRVHYTVFQCNKSQLFNTSFKKLSLCSLPGSPASGAWSVHDLGSWESVIMRRVSMARPSPARLASRESGGFKRQLPSITRHHQGRVTSRQWGCHDMGGSLYTDIISLGKTGHLPNNSMADDLLHLQGHSH